MRKFLLFVGALLVFSACVQEKDVVSLPNFDSEYADNESFVSLEHAMGNANFVYRNIDGSSERKREIKEVRLLTKSDVNTSVTRSSEEEEPLAYVVNYSNDQGFAILAANEELPPVIALGDEGCFSFDDFVGYVTGNTTRSEENVIDPAQELQYQIVNNSLNIDLSNVLIGPSLPNGIASDTTIILKCMPLVPVKWNQGAPYNKYAEVVDGVLCPAGCVPVAAAQVLASLCYHHGFRPTVDINSDYPINWNNINNLIAEGNIKFSSNTDNTYSNEVAKLIRALGVELDATYTPTGTGAYTSDLTSIYRELGLSNAVRVEGNAENLKAQLFSMIVDKNCPVNCAGYDEDAGGHSFIADGWLRLEYTHTVFNVGQINHTQNRYDLLHINFGWGGACDGYYLPGAFNTSSNKYDDYKENNDIDVNSSYNYNLGVHYIVYDL